jgi:hypothetical protein
MKLKARLRSIDTKNEWSEDPPFGDDRHYMTVFLNAYFRSYAHQDELGRWTRGPKLEVFMQEELGEHDLIKGLIEIDESGRAAFRDFCRIGDSVVVEFNGGLPLEWPDYYPVSKTAFVPESRFLNRLKAEMKRIAKENGLRAQVQDTWRHSRGVWRFVNKIAHYAYQNGVAVDYDLLKKGAFVHDFGRMYTGRNASREREEYHLHGTRGRDYFLKENDSSYSLLEIPNRDYAHRLARICERHMGGSGFTAETNQELGLGSEDTLAETIEEKIIGYADWRTHAKGFGNFYIPRIVSVDEAMQRTIRKAGHNPRQVQQVRNLIDYINGITNDKLR